MFSAAITVLDNMYDSVLLFRGDSLWKKKVSFSELSRF